MFKFSKVFFCLVLVLAEKSYACDRVAPLYAHVFTEKYIDFKVSKWIAFGKVRAVSKFSEGEPASCLSTVWKIEVQISETIRGSNAPQNLETYYYQDSDNDLPYKGLTFLVVGFSESRSSVVNVKEGSFIYDYYKNLAKSDRNLPPVKNVAAILSGMDDPYSAIFANCQKDGTANVTKCLGRLNKQDEAFSFLVWKSRDLKATEKLCGSLDNTGIDDPRRACSYNLAYRLGSENLKKADAACERIKGIGEEQCKFYGRLASRALKDKFP